MEHKLFIFLSSSANLGQAQVCSLRQVPLKLRQLDTSSKFHQTTPSSLVCGVFLFFFFNEAYRFSCTSHFPGNSNDDYSLRQQFMERFQVIFVSEQVRILSSLIAIFLQCYMLTKSKYEVCKCNQITLIVKLVIHPLRLWMAGLETLLTDVNTLTNKPFSNKVLYH